MSIFKYVQYVISCDRCEAEDSDMDNCNQQEAIEQLRKGGWTFGKRHLCPECNGNERYQ